MQPSWTMLFRMSQLWLPSTQLTQLDLNHHQLTDTMMRPLNWRSLLSQRTKLIRTTLETFITQTRDQLQTWLILRSTQLTQPVSFLLQLIDIMMKCLKWESLLLKRIKTTRVMLEMFTMTTRVQTQVICTPRLIQLIQLDLCHHLSIDTMMRYLKWESHSLKRTKMDRVMLETCITITKVQTQATFTLKSTQLTQPVLCHHQWTDTMTRYPRWEHHWLRRTKMKRVTWETCTMETRVQIHPTSTLKWHCRQKRMEWVIQLSKLMNLLRSMRLKRHLAAQSLSKWRTKPMEPMLQLFPNRNLTHLSVLTLEATEPPQ